MTDEPAAIQASFADFRLIKGRKQAQIVLEIPIEAADAALAALGGIPQPHSDRWVAVARLNGVTKPEPKPKKGVTYGEFAEVVENAYYKTHPEEAAKKQRWEDLKLSMQAVLRCRDAAFQRFLRENYNSEAHGDDDEDAANCVRRLCGVDSRSGLNSNLMAAAKWRDLDRSYQAWLKVAE